MADPKLVDVVSLVRQLQPALARRDRADLVDIIGKLVGARAAMGEQWEPLALLAAKHGELTLARAAYALFVEAYGGHHAAQYRQAGFFAHIGAWQEAHDLLATLPADLPSPIDHAYSRGTSALYIGDTEEARDQLERSIRLNPQLGAAWYSLSLAIDLSREPTLADRLIAGAPAMAQSAPYDRAPYFHALGKVHAGRGAHDLAFSAFAQGASAQASLLPYDRAQDERSAEQAIEGYDAAAITAIAATQSEPTSRTVFVTGLPRSGTTLVEQILTSHSEVDQGGESGRLSLLQQEVGGASFAALRDHVAAHGASSLARLWDHWVEERFPGARRIVDKTVDASRQLGLIAALFPQAPLIWVTRDPLDRAWSCFRTHFPQSARWSNDLRDIAFHFRLEDRLLARWQDILGERLLVLPHEELVAGPGPWTRRLLAHCGLAEEEAVFAPHENRRIVTTSSVQQVRRAINNDGIGASEPYRAHLQPFIDAYFG